MDQTRYAHQLGMTHRRSALALSALMMALAPACDAELDPALRSLQDESGEDAADAERGDEDALPADLLQWDGAGSRISCTDFDGFYRWIEPDGPGLQPDPDDTTDLPTNVLFYYDTGDRFSPITDAFEEKEDLSITLDVTELEDAALFVGENVSMPGCDNEPERLDAVRWQATAGTITIAVRPQGEGEEMDYAWVDVSVKDLEVSRGAVTREIGSFDELDIEAALEL